MTCEKVHSKLAGIWMTPWLSASACPAAGRRPASTSKECAFVPRGIAALPQAGGDAFAYAARLAPGGSLRGIKVAAAQGTRPAQLGRALAACEGIALKFCRTTCSVHSRAGTGGLFSAIVIFVFVLHMIVPGIGSGRPIPTIFRLPCCKPRA